MPLYNDILKGLDIKYIHENEEQERLMEKKE